jgi:hypothetical protein
MKRRSVARALCLSLVAAVLASCGEASPRTTPAAAEEGWSRLPAASLSPRRSSHALWVSGRLVIMGGTDASACPPNADCVAPEEPSRRDGAIFDPATEKWEPISRAPVPLGPGWTAVMGDRIYVLLYGHTSTHPSERPAFVSYDVSDDDWQELAHPDPKAFIGLVAAEPNLVAFQTTQENGYAPDFIYDPRSDAWTELPRDPLTPSFDRWMTWTPQGLVLTGIEHVPQPGVEPSIYRAAIYTEGRWERMPDSGIVGYEPRWTALNGNVVNISVGELDGGETNGWDHPYPIGGIFDPQSGRWRDLPEPPFEGEPWEHPGGKVALSGVYANDDRRAIAGQGLAFDARDRRWFSVVRPLDAPESELAATWTDQGLVVWGGVRWDGNEHALSADGWLWSPPSG